MKLSPEEIKEQLNENSEKCKSYLGRIKIAFEGELLGSEDDEEILLVFEDMDILSFSLTCLTIYDDGGCSSDRLDIDAEIKEFFSVPEFLPLDFSDEDISEEELDEATLLIIDWLRNNWNEITGNSGNNHALYVSNHFSNNQGINVFTGKTRIFYE